ncbi:hypothetical protein [Azospirillum agricola]|uniref:hypothetical protein n=1 Tax=Azospirillum agricola TaxID=1720247 RepID=UPI000A0F1AE7|nr:hypothetical protein [Azospirillum agricola]SMH62565.1 hypothetical protein SAMN02982994_6368 [Azospirillum lipoferum]
MTALSSKASAAWGGNPPAFVAALAQLADAQGLAQAGALIGYGKTAVSLVIANRYGAGLDRIEAAVTARLAVAPEPCPILGPIDAARCAREQATATRTRSLLGGLLRNACRSCPRRSPS